MAGLDPYEIRYRRQLAAAARRLRKFYEDSINELSLNASKITFQGEVFDLSKFPALEKQMDKVIARMHAGIYTLIVNGTKDSWDLSNQKNDRLTDRRLAGRSVSGRVRRSLYDANRGAMESFISRTEKGLNLSDRVWRTLDSHRVDLEKGLGIGISNGESAAEMAREQKKYLDDPDRLYRRVRDNYGKLKLSKPAREFTPGQGVYRSSYKNAYRLTRTETNMAYRNADIERWQTLPFVVGYEIRLSDAHPKFDICDVLAGRYPKSFNWSGWHPQCICFAVPIMMTDEEFDKLQDKELGLGDFDGNSVNQVNEVPAAFNKYVQDNEEAMGRWKNKPYWMRDNPELVKDARAAKLPKPQKRTEPPHPAGERIRPQFTHIAKPIAKTVSTALNSIDAVHGDGLLPNISFTTSRTTQYSAAFYSQNGTPVKIDLASKGLGAEIHIVHEMGHLFDLRAIGKAGQFETLQTDSILAPFLSVAKKSEAIRTVTKFKQDKTKLVDGKEFPISPRMLKFYDYMLNPKEIWARAYSQFIAKRSGNENLMIGLNKLKSDSKAAGYPYQWGDKDFEAIEIEIEKVMVELGWISQ